jgi:hypothetical protein
MQKIKFFLESEKGKDILIIVIIVLVGLVSFELGRLSNKNRDNGLKIENISDKIGFIDFSSNNTKSDGLKNNTNEDNYFASKSGKKYYSITCGAGKTIKQENRIYFSSVNEAISKGYELSSACR